MGSYPTPNMEASVLNPDKFVFGVPLPTLKARASMFDTQACVFKVRRSVSEVQACALRVPPLQCSGTPREAGEVIWIASLRLQPRFHPWI